MKLRGFLDLFFTKPPQHEGTEYVTLSERLRRAIRAFRYTSRYLPQHHTTYRGSDVASPSSDRLERDWQSFETRKVFIQQIDQILADDPFLLSGVQLLTHGAVGDGFNFLWKLDQKLATERQRIGIDTLYRTYDLIYPMFGQFCEEWFIYGDHYSQIVTDARTGRLTSIDAMPVETMVRCSDEQDRFIKPDQAYEQRDATTGAHIACFSDFEIVHARYHKRSKDRYGRSGLVAARQASLHALRGYSQLIERRERSNPKEVHMFQRPLSPHQLLQYVNGIPGHPETALPQMRAKWGDLSAVKNPDAFTIANGGDVKIIQGDPRFNEIDDLLALVDRSLAAVQVPRGLISGDVVNYATLNALWKQLFRVQQQLARLFEYHIVRPIMHRALLLVGVLPQEVPYECDWGAWQTPEDLQQNARIALAACRAGVWPVRETVNALARAVGRRDVDVIYAQLQAEWQNGILPTPVQLQTSGAATTMEIPQELGDTPKQAQSVDGMLDDLADDEIEQAASISQADIEYAKSLYKQLAEDENEREREQTVQ